VTGDQLGCVAGLTRSHIAVLLIVPAILDSGVAVGLLIGSE
jgi:hypothetical protein